MPIVSKSGKLWRNWAGNVQSRPDQIVFPGSIADVVAIVKQCAGQGLRIRVVGSGHSFTGLVQTDECLLSLDRLQGLASVDTEKGVAEVWAGTKLKALGELLHSHGLSQENLGDINAQSIAGAVSTGTHGTGIRFGSLSTQVVGLTIVTAAGEVVDCSAESHPSLFPALQVSLGLLGVIVKVRLRVIPKLQLRYESMRLPVETCLDHLDKWTAENRHFEFFLFPYSQLVQAKRMNETADPPSPYLRWNHFKQLILENGFFWLLSESCRLFPPLCPSASQLSAKAVPSVSGTGLSHRLFATPRLVRFHEMEYSVPADRMKEVIEEIQTAIERHRFAVHFPIECRYVKKDDIWLSPAYERDSAYIAVHMYKGMPYQAYFSCVEEIFWKYGGRPHWGKMHRMDTAGLHKAFPRLKDFLAVREEWDPQARFANDYLSHLLGIASGSP
ncbi:D-arabinono-1,4-lactone oxidase [Brevibacillus sp. FSL L8-0710]|uniref:D-arabinono-1,4-lactone oxidase n=1 Tax=Brevibacillus sp. FSL L8-0710 TaxID=2975313 RepID=UPI0030FC28BE